MPLVGAENCTRDYSLSLSSDLLDMLFAEYILGRSALKDPWEICSFAHQQQLARLGMVNKAWRDRATGVKGAWQCLSLYALSDGSDSAERPSVSQPTCHYASIEHTHNLLCSSKSRAQQILSVQITTDIARPDDQTQVQPLSREQCESYGSDLGGVLRSICKCTNLRALHLCSYDASLGLYDTSAAAGLNEVFTCCKSLTVVTFHCVATGPRTLSILGRHLHKLERLNFDEGWLPPWQIDQIFEEMAASLGATETCAKLTEIIGNHTPHISKSTLATICKCCPNLRRLNLPSPLASAGVGLHMNEFLDDNDLMELGKLKHLRELDLWGHFVRDPAIAHIARNCKARCPFFLV